MTEGDKDIWFPAKRYGWGWGFPITWQGWVVLIGSLAVVFLGVYVLLPERRPLFYGLLVVLTVIVGAIFRAKGEKPRWRWGGD